MNRNSPWDLRSRRRYLDYVKRLGVYVLSGEKKYCDYSVIPVWYDGQEVEDVSGNTPYLGWRYCYEWERKTCSFWIKLFLKETVNIIFKMMWIPSYFFVISPLPQLVFLFGLRFLFLLQKVFRFLNLLSPFFQTTTRLCQSCGPWFTFWVSVRRLVKNT